MRAQGGALRAACLVLAAALCAGCTGSSDRQPGAPGAQRTTDAGPVVTVGSFDFPESVLLAHIYAGALAAEGFRVQVAPRLGTREIVQPALMSGLIQLVPEYAGSALGFLSLGRVPASADTATTHRYLARTAARRGLVAGEPAPAQDNNAVAVTTTTARRYHLRSISDLEEAAATFVFGGPPECPQREYCLPGLRRTYGLRFRAFAPTDVGGPLTRQALRSGQIDVGLLFTTDPSIAEQDLVVLDDDRDLQPAENVTPLVDRAALADHGPRLLATLDAVSARLTTRGLRALNARVASGARDARAVAQRWLRSEGLSAEGQHVP